MAFGDKIKVEREKRNWSQNHLAKVSGVGQSTISAIELNLRSPTEETMIQISSALHVPLSSMLEDSEIKEKPAENGGLDEKLVTLLQDLRPEEVQRVRDFVSGLLSSRST